MERVTKPDVLSSLTDRNCAFQNSWISSALGVGFRGGGTSRDPSFAARIIISVIEGQRLRFPVPSLCRHQLGENFIAATKSDANFFDFSTSRAN